MTTLTKNNTILAFGDSLTFGHNAEEHESYPSVLNRLTGISITNAGISGETSEEGLKRLDTALEDQNIKLVILCFGGNDILQAKPISSLKVNLKIMIQKIKAINAKVLLLALPNPSSFILEPLALYQELADEEGVTLLEGTLKDIYTNPSLKSNTTHPNALGYTKMAEDIYKKLKEKNWVK